MLRQPHFMRRRRRRCPRSHLRLPRGGRPGGFHSRECEQTCRRTPTSRSQRCPIPPASRPPLLQNWAWQAEAVCREVGSEPFFGSAEEEGRRGRKERDRQAKSLCGSCPVVEACLHHALATHEPHGVWGGLTAHERRRLLTPAAMATRSST
ncbi:WhiB family transcriptional regulator [Streptomyces erythrochromogenes]|uniref:WhiB family transcriptional regulator n=1 Tax=Streptomyces erythrochromogenes TaxID=285574 RepID=UPI0034390179